MFFLCMCKWKCNLIHYCVSLLGDLLNCETLCVTWQDRYSNATSLIGPLFTSSEMWIFTA